MSPKRTFAVMIYCRQGIAIYPLIVSQRVSSKKKGRAGSHSSPARKVCRKDGEFFARNIPLATADRNHVATSLKD